MQKLKSLFRNASIAAFGAAVAAPLPSFAAELDVTEVTTAIDSATSKALEVGKYVAIGVAALVVVGLVIAIVRKI